MPSYELSWIEVLKSITINHAQSYCRPFVATLCRIYEQVFFSLFLSSSQPIEYLFLSRALLLSSRSSVPTMFHPSQGSSSGANQKERTPPTPPQETKTKRPKASAAPFRKLPGVDPKHHLEILQAAIHCAQSPETRTRAAVLQHLEAQHNQMQDADKAASAYQAVLSTQTKRMTQEQQ